MARGDVTRIFRSVFSLDMLLAVTVLQNRGTSRGYLKGHLNLAEQAGDSSVLPFHSEPLCCFCLCVCARGVFGLGQTLPVSQLYLAAAVLLAWLNIWHGARRQTGGEGQ